MPRPIREITGPHQAVTPVPPSPPSEKEQILLYLRQRQGHSPDSGLAYTADDITRERSPVLDALRQADDFPLDGTLKWVHGIRREPHDVRLGRIRGLLDELVRDGKVRCATGEDGQRYYWAAS